MPAAVHTTAQAAEAEQGFASLVGLGAAVSVKSTLHAFVDVFGQIAASPSLVLFDDGLYPIARWAMPRLEHNGGLVLPFAHHDPGAVERTLLKLQQTRSLPPTVWLVSDGHCPGCARPAPLAAYLAALRGVGGRLLVDDTQAVGLLGRGPSPMAPYGWGGGGSLGHCRVSGEDIVLVASLAKAFGAPLAMLAASRSFIDAFRARSEDLVHCSPPSQADVAAATRALAINARYGDALRARLLARVQTLRQALAGYGIPVRGGAFPVQSVPMPSARAAIRLQATLARRGFETIVQRARCMRETALTFILNARHSETDIRDAAAALAAAARGCHGPFPQRIPTLEA